jgi:hypothetical protein
LKIAQRLDQLQLHPFRQAADIVVRLEVADGLCPRHALEIEDGCRRECIDKATEPREIPNACPEWR